MIVLETKELDRFQSKIQIKQGPLDTPCHIWTGQKNKSGYGKVRIRRLKTQYFTVHRLIKAMTDSEFNVEDPTQLVCHKCDVPQCCNPDHLYVGNHATNVQDAIDRDRYNHTDQKGENNHNRKLTNAEVMYLIKDLKYLNNKQVARYFDNRVTHSQVSNIRLGKSRSDVTGIQYVKN